MYLNRQLSITCTFYNELLAGCCRMIGLVSRRIRCERVAGKDRKRGRDGSFNLLMEWALMTPELMDLAQIGPADSFGYQLYSMHGTNING